MEDIKKLLVQPVEGTDKRLSDVVIHHYNVREGGNVDPKGDPHGELKNQNVLTELPLKDLILDKKVYEDALKKVSESQPKNCKGFKNFNLASSYPSGLCYLKLCSW